MQIDGIRIYKSPRNLELALEKLDELGYDTPDIDPYEQDMDGAEILIHKDDGWHLTSHMLGTKILTMRSLMTMEWAEH